MDFRHSTPGQTDASSGALASGKIASSPVLTLHLRPERCGSQADPIPHHDAGTISSVKQNLAKRARLGLSLLGLHLGRHCLVELGEALAQPALRGHRLGHAPRDAARLAARERFGGEVIDARGEAVIDEAAKELFFSRSKG